MKWNSMRQVLSCQPAGEWVELRDANLSGHLLLNWGLHLVLHVLYVTQAGFRTSTRSARQEQWLIPIFILLWEFLGQFSIWQVCPDQKS